MVSKNQKQYSAEIAELVLEGERVREVAAELKFFFFLPFDLLTFWPLDF